MWADIILILVITVCVITDVKSRLIYNKVTMPAIVAAIALHTSFGGLDGLLMSLSGLFVGGAILLIPYFLGGMGAGDVKLLAVVGAYKGVSFVLWASFYMAVIGGLIALGLVLFKNGLMNRLRYFGYIMICLRYRMKPNLDGQWSAGTYPYGVAIAGGSVLCFLLKGWGAG